MKDKYDLYEQKYKKAKIFNIVLASLLVGMLLGGVLVYGLINVEEMGFSNVAQASNTKLINKDYESPVVEVAEHVLPSIVMIKSKVNIGRGFATQSVDKGTGSGIIYREDGYIITNNHVIEDASEIEVTLYDGRVFNARVIGKDPETDLAVIKIQAENLPAGTFGDSSKLKVGELAVAIGNPLGENFSGTVTSGIISALNRTLTIGEKELKLIQTDAAINPGNSGGALVNKNGEIIGINSVKLTSTGVEGMGFAIPINDALPIINELIQYGYVKRPWIGVAIANITDQIAERYDVPKGVYISKVYYNSPAAKAGLMVNDILTAINGQRIENIDELSDKISEFIPNDKIILTIYRDKKYIDIEVQLGIMPPQ
ncbi:S1C family serine protease [Caldisalinibacter kiritimatiensis]|uniref:Serine protease, DegP/HtrA n=1 Tax=Caldisalinibacter kiritimatiensis TaxID=1304284 RepID=R1CBQ3_9FIRM|nr:trypsin-like peptidase domain-containing protein [Caldisalinibacter kiritimatiensis]EOC99749.1 Serine protease, DegP/HtrA [Caldisalinibacter kiritimatiensis]